MNIFSIFKRKAAPASVSRAQHGWWPLVSEPFTGAWQQGVSATWQSPMEFNAVFSCITLIASDIAKISLRLHEKTKDGIWILREGNQLDNLIYKPNHYQTRQQFLESWVISKAARGNAYVLKERNNAGQVVKLHILHPDSVTPLVTEYGDVYYQLSADNLAGITNDSNQLVVPASDIIHDRYNCLYHPLVGLSPLYAASTAVKQGQNIQSSSSSFFGNNARPGGVLTAPGSISDDTAKRLKEHWDANYSGNNAGRVAVLGDGLKFEAMAVTAADSQLVEQLRWTAEVVCSVYHVPPYKIGVGQLPSYNNVQALNSEYYSQCLQRLIIDIQSLLNDGLDVPRSQGFRFDIESLLMMDTQTQVTSLKEAVQGGFMRPNSAAKRLNQAPVEGGDTFYLQQQNYSLQALARRDAQINPFEKEK